MDQNVQDIINKCKDICKKIEALSVTSSETAYKSLLSLKQKWSHTFTNPDKIEELADIEKRYNRALQGAVQTIQDGERNQTKQKESLPQTTFHEKLNLIIQNIDTLHSQTPLEKAIKDFIQLKKEWEQFIYPEAEKDKDLMDRYIKACDRFIQQRDWALWANYKKREEICQQLTELYNGPVNQGSIDRFTELRGEWKNIGPVPDRKQNTLWKKYRSLCKQIYEKNLDFYQEKEKEKEENLKIKNTLCQDIEALLNPDDWSEATQFVIKIQKSWDSIGPVPRDKSNEIWERYQKACNMFFQTRNKFYNEKRKNQQENLEKKKALYDQVESLKNSTNWKETAAEIKEIQKEWQIIGGGPHKKEKELWKKFRAACDHFFNARQMHFDNLEKEKPENLKKKEELCIIVESLETLPENEQYQAIIKAQEEWKKIGSVPKEMKEVIWERFRKPIDAFFEKKSKKKEKTRKSMEQKKILKEELCLEAESLCRSSEWRETSDKLKELQKKWKQIGSIEQTHEQALWQRFHAACDLFFNKFHKYKDTINKDKEKNLENKLDLCFQAEIIAEIKLTKEEEEARAEWQLKKLAENFWFKVLDTNKWEDKVQKMIELQKQWKEIGPVPSHMHEKIWKRFQKACNYFFEKRKKNHG